MEIVGEWCAAARARALAYAESHRMYHFMSFPRHNRVASQARKMELPESFCDLVLPNEPYFAGYLERILVRLVYWRGKVHFPLQDRKEHTELNRLIDRFNVCELRVAEEVQVGEADKALALIREQLLPLETEILGRIARMYTIGRDRTRIAFQVPFTARLSEGRFDLTCSLPPRVAEMMEEVNLLLNEW